jgi:hypothetical protein
MVTIFAMSLIVSAQADVPLAQRAEVEHLLKFLRTSPCQMERNGARHAGEKAYEHVMTKYEYFRKDIRTTEQFVALSATKSTMSGKYYMVYCPGRRPIRAQDWLLAELARFRNGIGSRQ